MICSEGYKAFRGTMRIVPKNPSMKPYELTADWLYKPEYQCWYGRGSSFPEEICEVLVDLTAPAFDGPLTIDELKNMHKEPVWIVAGNLKFWDIFWRIPNEYPEDKRVACFYKSAFLVDEYGEKWLAYRHKPVEGAV